MSGTFARLPEGRRGQVLALTLAAAALGMLWMAVASPLLDWYAVRRSQLAERRLVLAHMTQIVDVLPALRREAGRQASIAPPATALLGGNTDAIAGAALQGTVQDTVTAAGAALASFEVLPGEQQGGFRRIGLRVAVHGTWPELVAILRAMEESPLRLLVDDLELHATTQAAKTGEAPIAATFVVRGFRSGSETQPPDTGSR
jgi:hypothetical protein